MPHVYDNQDVLNSHFLQECEELLTTAFLWAIFVALFNKLVLIVNLDFDVGLADSVGKDLSLGLACLLPLLKVTEAEVDVILILDSCGVSLILDFLVGFNVTERDTIQRRLHLLD